MTAAPLLRNARASQLLPPATERKSSPVARYTSMYLGPMWCLWRFSAISRCSWDTNRIRASPLRRPKLDRHNATPPLLDQKKKLLNFQLISTRLRVFGCRHLLGHVQTAEKLCNILIAALPRKSTRSHHTIRVDLIVFWSAWMSPISNYLRIQSKLSKSCFNRVYGSTTSDLFSIQAHRFNLYTGCLFCVLSAYVMTTYRTLVWSFRSDKRDRVCLSTWKSQDRNHLNQII